MYSKHVSFGQHLRTVALFLAAGGACGGQGTGLQSHQQKSGETGLVGTFSHPPAPNGSKPDMYEPASSWISPVVYDRFTAVGASRWLGAVGWERTEEVNPAWITDPPEEGFICEDLALVCRFSAHQESRFPTTDPITHATFAMTTAAPSIIDARPTDSST